MMDADSKDSNELKDFMLVLRRALLLIVRWIEKRYQLRDSENTTK